MMFNYIFFLVPLVVLLQFHATSASTSSRYRFKNIATDPKSGLRYRRAPSKTQKWWLRSLKRSLKHPISMTDFLNLPWGSYGQPGVAVGDFNNDGVDDIYVTNGPGTPNSLFINLFPKTGKVKFHDVAKKVGVAATSQDSTGVCYGDLNNDGHPDFIVVSEFNRNKIFLSKSDGTYRHLPWVPATGDEEFYPSSGCSIGDVNNDGWLDIVVANAVRKDTQQGCMAVPFDLSSPDQLFVNRGLTGNGRLTFEETSLTSGINDIGGDIPPGKYGLSWTATLIDVNLDGNLDLVIAHDQCALPTKEENPQVGASRGAIRVQLGDGTGKFKSRTLEPVNRDENNRNPGGETWMGLGFGDFNCDGSVDIFAGNFGDYHGAKQEVASEGAPRGTVGRFSSRWWLGSSTGDFVDASVEETGVTNNDGDQDIISVGSLDSTLISGTSNPNVIHRNSKCNAKFSYDHMALEPTGTLRDYQGLALGDFNMDGYPDIAGASGYVANRNEQSLVYNYSSPFDATAYFTDVVTMTEAGLVWTGNLPNHGDMMVQLNRETERKKCWVSVQPMGMQGLVRGAYVNRGGLGATIITKPVGMRPVMAPIVSGDSFGSQHSPRRNFGLGKACRGTVDLLWPRGVRNRLYDVKRGEMLTIPEIPCSFDGEWESFEMYRMCVEQAVADMVEKKVATKAFGRRLNKSAIRARREHIRQ